MGQTVYANNVILHIQLSFIEVGCVCLFFKDFLYYVNIYMYRKYWVALYNS